MIDAVEPRPGSQYQELAWRGRPDVVRALLAVVAAMVGYLLAFQLVGTLLVQLCHAIWGHGTTLADYQRAAVVAFERPEGMAATHLTIAMLIPVSLLIARYVLGLSPRWLVSVQGRFRWAYLAVAFVIALLVFNAAIWLLQRISVAQLHPQPQFWTFVVVVLLTTPLQAAAEEFFFRGLLMTALGTLAPNRWVSIVGSALIFALFHGVQNGWLFADRFAFGVLAGWLVVRTGGLEAGIAAHVANNLCAFIYAGLTSTISAARTTTQVTWASAVADVGTFAAVAVPAAVVAALPGALHLRTRTAAPDLAAAKSVR